MREKPTIRKSWIVSTSGSQTAETEHYFDGGFTYKFTKDVQWDIRAGYGLNRAAADFFGGMGLSLRFR